MGQPGAADQQVGSVGVIDRREQADAAQIDRIPQLRLDMVHQRLASGKRGVGERQCARRAVHSVGAVAIQRGNAAVPVAELDEAADHRGDPSRTPSIRRATPQLLSSAMASGSNAAGRFWKATGRRKRWIAKVPTDVVRPSLVAGNGPP